MLPETSGDGLLAMADWYLTAKRVAERSPRTLWLYRRAVEGLVAYFSSVDGPSRIEDVTSEDLLGFFTDYRLGHAASSTLTMHNYLGAFFKWAVAEELIARDPMARVPRPRVEEEAAPRMVGDEEWSALLGACAGTDFHARRDMALLRLLESTGMRRLEAVTAVVADLDFDAQTLRVIGKGNRPRVTAFDDETSLALRHYLRLRARHRDRGRAELFLGTHGALRANSVNEMLERRCSQAGLDRVNPHAFRHRFGHRMKQAGMSEESMRALGGWSSQVYLERYGRSNRTARAVEEFQRIRRGRR